MVRAPGSTYRVQLNRDFGFAKAREALAFIAAMGITDLYVSPIFQARKGSGHGYDVTNPCRLNPELGPEEEFEELVRELEQRGMGLLLDIVPNHMAASWENPWWTDVLENGASSPYAHIFDVHWEPPARAGEERVVLPFLGRPYSEALERQELKLGLGEAGFVLLYFSVRLPLDVGSYRMILGPEIAGWPEGVELEAELRRLPLRDATDQESIQTRRRESSRIKLLLLELCERADFREYVEREITRMNGRPGDPRSFDALDDLIAAQPYIPVYWRVAREKVNYRRFFDVTDLIGIRAEDPEVFEATHALILELVRGGKASGLRVDHIDGLFRPRAYLERLRDAAGEFPYLAVEKILAAGEDLRAGWPVSGTTGYDFMAAVNGLLVDAEGLEECRRVYEAFTGGRESFEDVAYQQKKKVMEELFPGELRALGLHLGQVADHDRYGGDLSPKELEDAMVEVTACLRVYRTYREEEPAAEEDRRRIDEACDEAARRNPGANAAVLEFVRGVLKGEAGRGRTAEQSRGAGRFVMRWQQLTGPIMAKGVEDTALYLYNPLVSLNEVGGKPAAITPADFHVFCRQRRERWPNTMNATSTHDTKRGEDVRARIHVLTEIAGEWRRAQNRWRRYNRAAWREVDGAGIPGPNEETLLYQTMLGAWPAVEDEVPQFRERLKAYMMKAVREGKRHSSWMQPKERYEQALSAFIDDVLTEGPENRFLPHFRQFQKRTAFYGAVNSLAHTLLKIAAPGVPDFYQGSMLWDLNLVDPDNRRPVDFGGRLEILDQIEGWRQADRLSTAKGLLERWSDGRVKLFAAFQALECRRRDAELFRDGDYVPLEAQGARAGNVVAFARRLNGRWITAIAPRLTAALSARERWPLGRRTWKDTVLNLPEGAPEIWRNEYTGADTEARSVLELDKMLLHFPIALLSGGGR